MRILFSLLITFCIATVRAQSVAPPVEWQHCYGGTLDDYGYGISATSDGGFIFTGCAGSNDGNIFPREDKLHGGTCDYWGAKIAGDSTIQFKFHYGGTASDVSRTVLETSDGNYIVGGTALSNDVNVVGHIGAYNDPDFWVMKINSSSDILWQKCYGGSTYDNFGSLVLTNDGGYAMCGGTQSNNFNVSGNHGSFDFWLVKIDGSGNIQWQKCFGGSAYDQAFDLKACNDGGYIITGFTSSNDGDVTGLHGSDYDAWVVKTDANGNLQWQKCLGGSSQDAFYKVNQLIDGNFLLAGYTFSDDGDISGAHNVNTYRDDGWLAMLDQNGNLLWSKAYGGDSSDEFSTIRQDYLGGILVGGYSKSKEGDVSQNYGDWDCWLVSIDESGIILWDSTYGGPYSDVCTDLAIATDSRVALLGYSKSDSIDVSGNHGVDTSHHPLFQSRADFWVLDLGSVVGIHEVLKSTLTVIPTLAHDVVQVSSDDFPKEKSSIIIRNESGQEMMNETMNRESKLLLNISSLPQGIYFIEAKNSRLKEVSKFVKM